MQYPSGDAAGLDNPGGSAAMVADHQEVGAGRCHLGQNLFNHLSVPNHQGRVAN